MHLPVCTETAARRCGTQQPHLLCLQPPLIEVDSTWFCTALFLAAGHSRRHRRPPRHRRRQVRRARPPPSAAATRLQTCVTTRGDTVRLAAAHLLWLSRHATHASNLLSPAGQPAPRSLQRCLPVQRCCRPSRCAGALQFPVILSPTTSSPPPCVPAGIDPELPLLPQQLAQRMAPHSQLPPRPPATSAQTTRPSAPASAGLLRGTRAACPSTPRQRTAAGGAAAPGTACTGSTAPSPA